MIHEFIEERLRLAIAEVAKADVGPVRVQPCADARFGDYQTSALMALAKQQRTNPRQLAMEVAGRLEVGEWCHAVEVAGGGFLNFRVRPEALTRVLQEAREGRHLFHRPAEEPRTVVVDFSSPNVAKPMHVGHIRSTILGDCLTRTLRRLGHRVIADNHIGDWGTQFGKLIVGWKRCLDAGALASRPLEEMERLYRQVNTLCEQDPGVLEAARQELVKLQGGDQENRGIWERMIQESRKEFDVVYARLGVRFDHTLGASFYNSQLGGVVRQLVALGVARESEGAMVVFFEDVPELRAHPAIVRKSDGAANYATTDLATLDHRERTWHPDEIVYVTDGRQQLHFRQIFSIYRRWRPESRVRLAHVWFGSILGEDGKPFRTRSGETVRLADLLDEAEERALGVVREKNPDLAEDAQREIARIVGLGAVKYADLLPNRQSDYVFNWDKMLAFQGNTAPYLQYAYTRIRSIFRKGGLGEDGAGTVGSSSTTPVLQVAEEIALARQLVNFGLVLKAVAEDYRPNYLCNYLYDLAGLFARFYEQCPVLKAGGTERESRLVLCDLTARVIRQGLDALGIETTEQM